MEIFLKSLTKRQRHKVISTKILPIMAPVIAEKYQQFYMDNKNKLFSYLLYKSGDREVAKDIMQESFTRHFKHYGHQFVDSPSLLYTIARNALVDYQRDRTRFYRAEIPPQEKMPDEETSFLVKEQNSRVQEALAKLSEEDREMITLVAGGMAYRDIGAILDLSAAAVKVRIHRARIKLRTLLNNRVG